MILIRSIFLMIPILMFSTVPACADPDVNGGSGQDQIFLEATQTEESRGDSGPLHGAPTGTEAAGESGPIFVKYRWMSVCANSGPTGIVGQGLDCGQAQTCPTAHDRLWRLWGQTPDGDWSPLGEQCAGPAGPPPAATPKPQVTPGLVLTELRRIGLPSLQARTQPRDKTLVNFATIFYAEPQTFTRTLTLLGQSVDVEATPASFTWHYGDGSSATTSTPGAPYPAKDVTHSYTDAHTTVQTSVDVTYSARFRVGNGAWQTIPDRVTIAGPAGALRISEATAVLSGEYH
jgi:hypothetical protein